jgi:hypothetical protein
VDDAVELLAMARTLNAGYGEAELPLPEVVSEAIDSLNSYIQSKRKDELARQLKKLEAEAANDVTAEERRQARKASIEKVKAELGK